jgi:predicted DNA repair protein MutK
VSTGLIALLDDVAAIAKLAAASLDDAAAQAAKAGSKAASKAAGIVIDDAAVTPRYVVGFAADRELPIIGKIASGSLKNKLLFLLPGALLLGFFAPWAITPLLMLGGAFLCLEGWHKVADLFARGGHGGAADANGNLPSDDDEAQTPKGLEGERVSSAIRTDFILSAEIMAITLATLTGLATWVQAVVLGLVGIGMTVAVYGVVALIVKADDFGALLARTGNGAVRALGRGIVLGMPLFLQVLSTVGMVAMLWVGGHIVIHGAYELGLKAPEQWVQGVTALARAATPVSPDFVAWIVRAAIDAVAGLAVGALVAPLADKVLGPAVARLKSLWPGKRLLRRLN